MIENKASVIVIGAGHAGIEAALASARMGVDTVVFTTNLDAVGNMPCNPSVGGSAKGHLVFEIDALGGEMGYAADLVTLQSRTLNLGKGAAVHSKRTQVDRDAYKRYMKRALEKEPNLRLVQANVTDIVTEEKNGKKRVTGVVTHLGEAWRAEKVVIATGTFLESEIFVGDKVYSAGPDGMMPSCGLSASLEREGIKLQRFKTGTPARVHRRSIDFTSLEEQKGEADAVPFSVRSDPEKVRSDEISCHIVYTNLDTHKIITDNLDRSAMYSGNIVGTGPRYCPSIETKLVRFADKERHQLFVEPCGEDTDEMYIQGFSTSMPTDVQYDMLRSLEGFENAEIMRYAYAIEYDSAEPTGMLPTLEFKAVSGLYGAGQFNGTSGYEEAAAQGLIAGINAARKNMGKEPLVLSRASSYIGTLIDDLVTKGCSDPYRMMTSRSEYRLLLRQDNADERLMPIGREIGLISDETYEKFLLRKEQKENEIARLRATTIAPAEELNKKLASLGTTPLSTGIKLAELIKRPEVSYFDLAEFDSARPDLPYEVALKAETEIKYEGYIARQQAQVDDMLRLENRKLPSDIDYMSVEGLRLEAREKLSKIRPQNIGQASRISGVSPSDVTVLLILTQKGKMEEKN